PPPGHGPPVGTLPGIASQASGRFGYDLPSSVTRRSTAMSLPTLLLLPGLLSDGTAWEDVAALLADETGIAVPDYEDCDDLGAMAERALATAAGPLSVAGHSMGARVALEMVARAPDRIVRLALFDTGTRPVAPGEPEKRQVLVDLAFREGM